MSACVPDGSGSRWPSTSQCGPHGTCVPATLYDPTTAVVNPTPIVTSYYCQCEPNWSSSGDFIFAPYQSCHVNQRVLLALWILALVGIFLLSAVYTKVCRAFLQAYATNNKKRSNKYVQDEVGVERPAARSQEKKSIGRRLKSKWKQFTAFIEHPTRQCLTLIPFVALLFAVLCCIKISHIAQHLDDGGPLDIGTDATLLIGVDPAPTTIYCAASLLFLFFTGFTSLVWAESAKAFYPKNEGEQLRTSVVKELLIGWSTVYLPAYIVPIVTAIMAHNTLPTLPGPFSVYEMLVALHFQFKGFAPLVIYIVDVRVARKFIANMQQHSLLQKSLAHKGSTIASKKSHTSKVQRLSVAVQGGEDDDLDTNVTTAATGATHNNKGRVSISSTPPPLSPSGANIPPIIVVHSLDPSPAQSPPSPGVLPAESSSTPASPSMKPPMSQQPPEALLVAKPRTSSYSSSRRNSTTPRSNSPMPMAASANGGIVTISMKGSNFDARKSTTITPSTTACLPSSSSTSGVDVAPSTPVVQLHSGWMNQNNSTNNPSENTPTQPRTRASLSVTELELQGSSVRQSPVAANGSIIEVPAETSHGPNNSGKPLILRPNPYRNALPVASSRRNTNVRKPMTPEPQTSPANGTLVRNTSLTSQTHTRAPSITGLTATAAANVKSQSELQAEQREKLTDFSNRLIAHNKASRTITTTYLLINAVFAWTPLLRSFVPYLLPLQVLATMITIRSFLFALARDDKNRESSATVAPAPGPDDSITSGGQSLAPKSQVSRGRSFHLSRARSEKLVAEP